MTRNANPSEATIASELLRKLAEKERKRKFDSIGLADPRVVEPSSSSKAIEDEEVVSKDLEKKDEDKTFKKLSKSRNKIKMIPTAITRRKGLN